jgi:tetratricopeptide (TPR) repeat protein
VKRENLAFLIGGFAFGVLFGFALVSVIKSAPQLEIAGSGQRAAPSPAGPMAPTQVGTAGAEGGAPMMAEINALKRRLQESAEDVEALIRLANIYHDVAMWEQAVGYYERALAFRPDNADLLTDLGVCFRGLQEFDRALEQFDRARAADSAHWQSLFNTAVVTGLDLGQFDRALEVVASMEAMSPAPPRLAELRHALEQARATAQQGG